MYENLSYELILDEMLQQASLYNPSIDTREGSVVWYGLAPAALEMQNLYLELDQILGETFADTATRAMLIKRASERGLAPYSATKASLKGVFTPKTLEIAPGARFSLDSLNYVVLEKLSSGEYRLECESEGDAANGLLGTLIPIEHIALLETAKLTELLIPGENEEPTEALRQRYFDSLSAAAFGGNVADYRQRTNALSGVGGVRVYPAWNSDISPSALRPPDSFAAWLSSTSMTSEIKNYLTLMSSCAKNGLLTVGGAVRLVIIDSAFGEPSGALLESVQSAIDPVENHGEGLGLAPIGHYVTVQGVSEVPLEVFAEITYSDGWDWDATSPYAEEAIDAYFKELAQSWADETEPLIVRVSQIETRLLSCPGVIDVADTYIDGLPQNLRLGADCIPVRGDLYG